VIIIEASPLNEPKYVTVVEAGLLAKFGMNSQGFGIATNALVSSFDEGRPGIPYHILLRGLLKMSNTIEGVVLLNKAYRSSSANYLLADKHGMSIDVETMTGDWKNIAYQLADSGGVLIHTNHFLTSRFVEFDISPGWIPSTLFRLQKLVRDVEREKDVSNPESWKNILCGHLNIPYGICAHEVSDAREEERFSTITSGVMNLNTMTLEITAGPPCSNEYIKIDYSTFFN
jgi:isopenicillin-N N-acyltransferase-like protein